MLLLAASLANAQVLTLSAAGGVDYPTANPWTGVTVGLPARQQEGFAFQGSLTPGYGFFDASPLAITELGTSFVVPEKAATVRLGILARAVFLTANHTLPVQLGTTPTETRRTSGFVPGGMVTLEFAWTEEAPLTIGFKGGLGSAGSGQNCVEGGNLALCTTWYTGFIGGFSASKQFRNGLLLEVVAGTTSSLSIGYAVPLRGR